MPSTKVLEMEVDVDAILQREWQHIAARWREIRHELALTCVQSTANSVAAAASGDYKRSAEQAMNAVQALALLDETDRYPRMHEDERG